MEIRSISNIPDLYSLPVTSISNRSTSDNCLENQSLNLVSNISQGQKLIELIRRIISQITQPTGLVEEPYIKKIIPTSIETGNLHAEGMCNYTEPQWIKVVQEAAELANGYGNPEEGYLAWSDKGFILFKNDTIPDDLSKRYAEMTLLTGVPIEKLKITNEYSADKIDGKIEFADKFEAALAQFQANPAAGFKVDGGGVLYEVAPNEKGGIVFFRHKKKNWFQKAMGTIVKWAKPVLDVVGTVFPPARIVTMPLSIGLSTANGLSQAQYAESVIDARNQSAGINA